MHRLNSEYWDKFKKMNKQGELVGDGLAFENLIEALLKAKYGISWNSTLKSHDNNRDFWLLLENEHLWAECKNYQDTIAMNVLAPTLVMAQIYQVNTILFFSQLRVSSAMDMTAYARAPARIAVKRATNILIPPYLFGFGRIRTVCPFI